MNKNTEVHEGQFEYLGRWVNKEHFCAFVYNGREQRLVQSYNDFVKQIETGLWFTTKEEAIHALDLINHDDLVIHPEIPKVINQEKLGSDKYKDSLRKAKEATKSKLRAATPLGN